MSMTGTQTRHHIFMPPEMMDRLREAKEITGVPVAEFIRRAIDAALQELQNRA